MAHFLKRPSILLLHACRIKCRQTLPGVLLLRLPLLSYVKGQYTPSYGSTNMDPGCLKLPAVLSVDSAQLSSSSALVCVSKNSFCARLSVKKSPLLSEKNMLRES